MLSRFIALFLLLALCNKGFSQYFQKEFVAQNSITGLSFNQLHQYPDSSIVMCGLDHVNKSFLYTFKMDRCRNYKVAYKYDLKNCRNDFHATNLTIVSGNSMIAFPGVQDGAAFYPLLKFDNNGKLTRARKVHFNTYLLYGYRHSGICKINENKFGVYFTNYGNTSDSSFGLIIILDTNFNILNSCKIFNKESKVNNGVSAHGIYYMNKKIIIDYNESQFSEIDTNLIQIKSYLLNGVFGGSSNASQINDSLLFYSGAGIYDVKNKKLYPNKNIKFISNGSYEKRNISQYIFGGGYGASGNSGTIVSINPKDFSNNNIEGKGFSRISDFEVVNNNKDIISINFGANKKGQYPILTKSKLDDPFYCSSKPAPINFANQSPISAVTDTSFVLIKSNINIRMEDYMPEITETVITFKLITKCTTEEPFSGIGSNIGIDEIIACSDKYTITTMNPDQTSKFYWSTGDTTKTITVTKTGVYKLRTVKGRCESIDEVLVTFAKVSKPKVFSDTILCIGNTVSVDATKNQTFSTTYLWQDKQTSGKRVISKKGDYKLVISNNYGCKDSLRFSVAYRDSLKATIMQDTLICKGALAKLYVNVSGGWATKHSISWYNSKNGLIGNGYTLYNAFDASEKVKAVITDSCTNYSITKFVNIKVRPPLQITYLSDTSICLGQSINLFTDGSGGDSSAYSFVWNNNLGSGQSKTVSPLKTTFYRVILKDNCTLKSDTASCIISVPPVVARANAVPEITDIEHPQVVFKNNSTPSVLNKWDFGNGLQKTSNNRNDIEVLYSDTGFFYITLGITSPVGCLDDTTIRIRIKDIFRFYIPNAFTPDGDGLNEEFVLSTRGVRKFRLTLYDRWGGILFETDDPEKGWDAKGYPIGVYVYKVELYDQEFNRHFKKGSFHLVR